MRDDAAAVLERSLQGFRGQLTVADAAARSGLPTHQAAAGLTALASTHSGQLAATEKGELIYLFPRGLVRTDRAPLATRVGRALAKVALGVVRFVVRAWVSVVLVGYAVVFVGIAIALAAKDDDNDGVGVTLAMVFRVLAEAVFWTFHPFSPANLAREPGWLHGRGRRRSANQFPFYERVNRFVFGPAPPVEDPRATSRKVLEGIRRGLGRIVPGDVMQLTGAGRDDAERLLLRLTAEHEGDITVSEGGAILYEFPKLRSTAHPSTRSLAPLAAVDRLTGGPLVPAWTQPVQLRPLTGNSLGSNVLIGGINAFNLVMGTVGLSTGLTIERLVDIVTRVRMEDAPPLPPADGLPLVFGVIPLAFSAVLFAIPAVRAWRRRAAAARVAHENHMRAILRRIFAGGGGSQRFSFTLDELARACAELTGRPAGAPEVERAVRALGGTVDLGPDGTLLYTFEAFEREQAAVVAQRRLAAPDEASPGAVVFSSADDVGSADR